LNIFLKPVALKLAADATIVMIAGAAENAGIGMIAFPVMDGVMDGVRAGRVDGEVLGVSALSVRRVRIVLNVIQVFQDLFQPEKAWRPNLRVLPAKSARLDHGQQSRKHLVNRGLHELLAVQRVPENCDWF
jgi:hypothetical protein